MNTILTLCGRTSGAAVLTISSIQQYKIHYQLIQELLKEWKSQLGYIRTVITTINYSKPKREDFKKCCRKNVVNYSGLELLIDCKHDETPPIIC